MDMLICTWSMVSYLEGAVVWKGSERCGGGAAYTLLSLCLKTVMGASCTLHTPGLFSGSHPNEKKPGSSVLVASKGDRIWKGEERGG